LAAVVDVSVVFWTCRTCDSTLITTVLIYRISIDLYISFLIPPCNGHMPALLVAIPHLAQPAPPPLPPLAAATRAVHGGLQRSDQDMLDEDVEVLPAPARRRRGGARCVCLSI
jgi:hypothetical protein